MAVEALCLRCDNRHHCPGNQQTACGGQCPAWQQYSRTPVNGSAGPCLQTQTVPYCSACLKVLLPLSLLLSLSSRRCCLQEYGADAVIHFGMHGTVEWLPGSPLGNTGGCRGWGSGCYVCMDVICSHARVCAFVYQLSVFDPPRPSVPPRLFLVCAGLSWSDVLLGPLPNVYLYAANNPSESIIAKRRGYGTIVSHNVPPYGRAGEGFGRGRAWVKHRGCTYTAFTQTYTHTHPVSTHTPPYGRAGEGGGGSQGEGRAQANLQAQQPGCRQACVCGVAGAIHPQGNACLVKQAHRQQSLQQSWQDCLGNLPLPPHLPVTCVCPPPPRVSRAS